MHVPLRALFTLILLPLYAAGLAGADPDDRTDAETYTPGDKFTALSVRDQHDQPASVSPTEGVRHLVVSFARGPGQAANRFFAAQRPGFLDAHHALFLADIHRMPGVARRFAQPRMRQYPHRILLGDDPRLLERVPAREGRLTVLDFSADGTIAAIRFLDPAQDLAGLFAR